MEPMVHEDQEPGHESRLEPKPDWEPRYPRIRPAQGKGRARSPAPTAASAGRSRHCSPAKARTSRSSICASMTTPRRRSRSSRRKAAGRSPSPATSATSSSASSAVRADGRSARQARHPRQQCRRAALRQGHHRHRRAAAPAHVPDQHLRHVLHDAGRACRTSSKGSAIVNCDVGDDLQGIAAAARLQRRPRERSSASPDRSPRIW